MDAPTAHPATTKWSGQGCPQCGSTALREELVKSALWQGERLVVVENIPAVVCGRCGERFYDDATVTALDLLQGDGFPAEKATARIDVPVFSFSHRVPADMATELAEQE
ncbi:type II toxin-antitoxin system MqsA family antitoxin [Chelativorans sp. AA-79]|uniref:type II toxin-antitoxin system MqsA family antitoxin n=1 Tax=Chelativorans sp. AA-79 TaxID=3028735 RepID=UPI0023F982EF|nr:type II toxin-antitoxin system MqsA family antitoxin [Chelativorans sp. AA-79]WEX10807.1 type II toxin-antitoxin system MqsA family antitoxin [Chelativorans sp. AA-79]